MQVPALRLRWLAKREAPREKTDDKTAVLGGRGEMKESQRPGNFLFENTMRGIGQKMTSHKQANAITGGRKDSKEKRTDCLWGGGEEKGGAPVEMTRNLAYKSGDDSPPKKPRKNKLKAGTGGAKLLFPF